MSDGKAISLRREQRSGESIATLRRTVGLGWALLLPWDVALDWRWWPLNALWLAMLFFPVSFLTARVRHLRGSTVAGSAAIGTWPVGLTLVTLLAVPTVLGLSLAGPGDWLGVVIGVASGVLVQRPARRWLSKDVGLENGPSSHP